MVSFEVCRKCELCTYHEPEYDEMDNLMVPPSVICDKTGDMLYMADEPPKDCEFYLEQIMFSQEIPEEFAQSVSKPSNR